MKKLVLSLFLLLIGLTGFSKIVTITNSGNTFTPSTATITFGDSVKFTIGNMHNVIEVSKQIWDANEASALSGGFQLPMSGGILIPEQLAIGTHYYVCGPHAAIGMKGSIIVLGPSNVATAAVSCISFFPNPASDLISVKTTADIVGSTYRIMDITGKQVATGKLENFESWINISHLTTGIYFFQTLSQKEELFKFIKTN